MERTVIQTNRTQITPESNSLILQIKNQKLSKKPLPCPKTKEEKIVYSKPFEYEVPGFLFHSLFNCNCAGHSRTDHRVVAHADKSHHFNVSRNGGRTCKLGVGVHSAHGVGHAV